MSDHEYPSTSWANWAWNAYREGRLVKAPDPAAIRESALREAAEMLSREGFEYAPKAVLALITEKPHD